MAKDKKDISGHVIVAMVAAAIGAGGGYFLAGGNSGGEYKDQIKRIEEARELIAEQGDPNFSIERAKAGMIDGFVKGGGDRYAGYSAPPERNETADMSDEVNSCPTAIGSGFRIGKSESGNILLTDVEPDMPAEAQGLKIGDEITHIDGVSVSEQGYENYARKILGKPDTEVTLTVLRSGKEFDIVFKRVNEGGQTVEHKKIGNVGYIRILHFDVFGGAQFRTAVDDLKGVKSVIVDVRNCPGGTTSEAVDMASLLVESGKVRMEAYNSDSHEFDVAQGNVKLDVPIVVLINENSKSSSEVFAALLKDGSDKCSLVGEKTFGKGVFQQNGMLESGGTIRFTGGKYYVNDRENWQDIGIAPDVEVKMDSKNIGTDDDVQLKKALELLD